METSRRCERSDGELSQFLYVSPSRRKSRVQPATKHTTWCIGTDKKCLRRLETMKRSTKLNRKLRQADHRPGLSNIVTMTSEISTAIPVIQSGWSH